MAKTKHNAPFAAAYAASLLELAKERQQAEPIRQELGNLRQIVSENHTFQLFLADPAISETERFATFDRIFAGQLSPLMHNFIGVLNDRNRLGALIQIADAYGQLLDEQLGRIDVDVTVAGQLTPEQLEEVRQKVSFALKKEAIVHEQVDESIIGGLVVRVQDKLIDASVRTQLAAMKEQLLAARTK